MNKKLDMKSLTIGVLVGTFICVSVAATTGPRGRTTWEYKTVENYAGSQRDTDGSYFGLDVDINASVAEGWDFVSASGSSSGRGFAVLKRKVKQEEK